MSFRLQALCNICMYCKVYGLHGFKWKNPTLLVSNLPIIIPIIIITVMITYEIEKYEKVVLHRKMWI